MADKIKVSAIRTQFPMYGDMSDEQLVLAVRKKFYGDMPLADFANRIDFDTERERNSPAGKTFASNLLPAAGAGMASIARALGGGGVLERFGLPGTKAEADRLEAPLNDAPGGTTGRILGIGAPLALTAAIPGANTLLGASLIGAGAGAATTEGGLGDRAAGAALGGAGGLVGLGLGRGVGALWGAGKGLVEPFREGGVNRIAGGALNRFATRPNAYDAGHSITGAQPTLAEANKDAGLETLKRALMADPQTAEMFAQRELANNAARINALEIVAGRASPKTGMRSPGVDEAKALRKAAADISYAAARKEGVNEPMADALRPQIDELLKRPEIQRAVAQAKELAQSEGIVLNDMGSAQGLQYAKQSLDDMIGALGPKEKNKLRLWGQTSSDLKSVLDEIAPKLRRADAEFAANSVPVMRAQVGERLLDATTSAGRDFAGNRRLQSHAFSRALNNEEQLLKQATGGKYAKGLNEFMTAPDMARINAIRSELETAANLASAANGPGSQTAKMLASQHLLRSVTGPLGLPESFGNSSFMTSMMRSPQFLLKHAEEKISEAVAAGLLNPVRGRQLMLEAAREAAKPQAGLLRLPAEVMPGLLGYGSAQLTAGQ